MYDFLTITGWPISNFVLLLQFCSVGFSFFWCNSFKYAAWCFHNLWSPSNIIFPCCFCNIYCSYWDGLVIPLLEGIQTLRKIRTLCHCYWKIYCSNNMKMVKRSSNSRSVDFNNVVSVCLRKVWTIPILELSWVWKRLENNLLVPSWSHALLRTWFLNSVPL